MKDEIRSRVIGIDPGGTIGMVCVEVRAGKCKLVWVTERKFPELSLEARAIAELLSGQGRVVIETPAVAWAYNRPPKKGDKAGAGEKFGATFKSIETLNQRIGQVCGWMDMAAIPYTKVKAGSLPKDQRRLCVLDEFEGQEMPEWDEHTVDAAYLVVDDIRKRRMSPYHGNP